MSSTFGKSARRLNTELRVRIVVGGIPQSSTQIEVFLLIFPRKNPEDKLDHSQHDKLFLQMMTDSKHFSDGH